MNLFNWHNKEKRSEPEQNQQLSYEQQRDQQSYCSLIEKRDNFISMLMQKYKYDALSISTVFACMNIISNNLAKIPWELKQNNDVINPTYLDDLLVESNLSSFIFIKQMILDVLKQGDGYAYIYRDKDGRPMSLRYLRHDTVLPVYNEITDTLYYQIPILNKKTLIEPINVIHFVMNSKDGITGKGVLQFAHNILDLAGYTEKAATDYFKNGMSVQGILSSPTQLKEDKRNEIRQGWNATPDNIRILEGGLKYEAVQSSSREAELTSNRAQNAIEICRFFGVSPTLVGDLSHSVYNQIEQAQLDLVQNTLSPYILMMEKEINRKLLTYSQRKSLYIDLYEDILIKQDKKTFIESVSALTDKAIITRNEARIQLGYPRIDDDFADKLSLTYKDNEAEQDTQLNTDKEDEQE